MNAIVEVTTAKVEVKANEIAVIATVHNFLEVFVPQDTTSGLRVLDILRYSIEPVAPNNTYGKELALAGA